jgi:hypothetical protein
MNRNFRVSILTLSTIALLTALLPLARSLRKATDNAPENQEWLDEVFLFI